MLGPIQKLLFILVFTMGIPAHAVGDRLTSVEMKAHLDALKAPLDRKSSQELYGSAKVTGFKDRYFGERNGVCRTENYNGLMKSNDGRMLAAACKRAKNFLKIYEKFRACNLPVNFRDLVMSPVLKSASERDLKEIAAGLGADCNAEKNKLSEMIQAGMDMTHAGIVDRLQEISIRNAAKAYWHYSQTLPTQKARSPEEVLNALCKKPVRGSNWGHCTKSSEDLYRKIITELAKQPLPKASATDIAAQTNAHLEKLDTAAKAVTAKVNGGILFNSPDISDATRTSYSKFVETYVGAAQDQYGVLLTTETMQKTVGRLHTAGADTLDIDDFKQKNVGIGNFYLQLKGYSQIPKGKESVITQASEELLSNIALETDSLNKIRSDNEDVRAGRLGRVQASWTRLLGKTVEEKSLHRLIRTNPVAVGELLMDHPDLATTVCLAMKDMVSDQETEDAYKKTFVAGGVVLAATGVGAGLVGAGAGALAVLSAAGVGAATGNAAIDWDRYSQAKESLYSYQSKNGTATAPLKVQEAWNQAVKSTQDVGIEAAGVIGGYGVGKVFHGLAEAGHFKQAGEFADGVKKVAVRIKNSKYPQKIVDFLERTGFAGEDAGTFISRILKEPDEIQEAFFKKIEAGFTPKEAEKFARGSRSGC